MSKGARNLSGSSSLGGLLLAVVDEVHHGERRLLTGDVDPQEVTAPQVVEAHEPHGLPLQRQLALLEVLVEEVVLGVGVEHALDVAATRQPGTPARSPRATRPRTPRTRTGRRPGGCSPRATGPPGRTVASFSLACSGSAILRPIMTPKTASTPTTTTTSTQPVPQVHQNQGREPALLARLLLGLVGPLVAHARDLQGDGRRGRGAGADHAIQTGPHFPTNDRSPGPTSCPARRARPSRAGAPGARSGAPPRAPGTRRWRAARPGPPGRSA